MWYYLGSELMQQSVSSSLWLMVLIFSFILGSCWGSFLNVCIWRLPRRESVVTVPSHCTKCHKPIAWYDNLPVISYLVLRGRCRHCKEPYSPRYLAVEVLMGLLFAGLVLYAVKVTGNPAAVWRLWILAWYLTGCVWIDLKHRLIPDAMSYPVLTAGVILLYFVPSGWQDAFSWERFLLLELAVLIIIGGIAWTGEKFFHRTWFGYGDVKLLAVLSLLLGWPGAYWMLLFAALSGTLCGTVKLVLSPKSGKSVAFAPHAALGTILFILLENYLRNTPFWWV